jgi:hypothetical protein
LLLRDFPAACNKEELYKGASITKAPIFIKAFLLIVVISNHLIESSLIRYNYLSIAVV